MTIAQRLVECGRLDAAARLRARDLDPDLSALVGGRAVLRVLDAVPETAVVEALERKKPEALTSTLGEGGEGAEESSDATSDSGETSSTAPGAASSSSSSDEDPDASDASVFMRDVPGEKGKQGALGGASAVRLDYGKPAVEGSATDFCALMVLVAGEGWHLQLHLRGLRCARTPISPIPPSPRP